MPEKMTRAEFDAGHDGLHVPLTCEDHPDLRWSCKKIALSQDAGGKWRYNGHRRIFYVGSASRPDELVEECECPTDKIYALFEEV